MTHDTLTVVSDQIGTPTYTYDLAKLVVDMAETDKYGKYHVTNEGGYISWADFAKEIFRLAGKETKVQEITTEEFGAPAARPAYSVLENYMFKLTGDFSFAPWKEAISEYMKTL